MMSLRRMISRKWWKTTLLIILAVAVMIRLGIWQLDRLAQRRAFNARVLAQQNQPQLDLNGLTESPSDSDLFNMEYRAISVTGEYDHGNEVVLRNQVWNNLMGVHVFTPLRISGSDQALMVDRGWIPFEDFSSGYLAKYSEPGLITVQGIIRRSQHKSRIGGRADPIPAPGDESLLAWNFANIEGIAAQIPYSLLPVYIQQAPDPAWTSLPYRGQPELDLTEGPHLGYAFQWFIFASILAVGYPFYIRREENSASLKPKNHLNFMQPVPDPYPPTQHDTNNETIGKYE